MASPTDIARANIFTVLIGLAAGYAIEAILKDKDVIFFMTVHVFNTISFLLLLVLFYHGKFATTESADHIGSLEGRPTIALVDYALHFTVVLAIVVGAFSLKSMAAYTLFNLTLRIVDFILVTFLATLVSPYTSRLEFRAQLSWMLFDTFSAVIYLVVYINLDSVLSFLETISPFRQELLPSWLLQGKTITDRLAAELALSLLFLILIIADVIMDSTVNRRFYAGQQDD